MSKLVLHLFHDDPASLSTVPAAEGALAGTERKDYNAQIDNLVKLGVRVTACIGLAQKYGAEAAFRGRGIALESAALAFPRFASEAATVISF